MGLEYRFNIPQTYCEKWPAGCQFCDLILCDGKNETAITKISERDYKTCAHKCGESKCVEVHTAYGYCNLYSAKVKPTNADRIRAMTDEELDRFLGEVQWDVANYCGDVIQKMKYPLPKQRGAWLDWLKQEAEDGN